MLDCSRLKPLLRGVRGGDFAFHLRKSRIRPCLQNPIALEKYAVDSAINSRSAGKRGARNEDVLRRYLAVGLIVEATQESADQVQRVAAVGEKATLLGPLAGIHWQLAELALPDGAQLFVPVDFSFVQCLLDGVAG